VRGTVVTIDGPAGSGKSTVARRLADALGLPFLSTGLLYRALAWASLQPEAPADAAARAAWLTSLPLAAVPDGRNFRIEIAGEPIPEPELRREDVGRRASEVAADPQLRDCLLGLQRAAAGPQGLVAEGRDVGSVVFPDADARFFVTADAAERARRRALELGLDADDPMVRNDLLERDRRDAERAAAPLVVPPGAAVVDTTGRTVDEVVATLLQSASLKPVSRAGASD
jgi:cytidylate kinase